MDPEAPALTNHKSGFCALLVKSRNFGHRVNSDTHFQTVEIQIRRRLMSRLIRMISVCLVGYYFYSNDYNMNQTRSLSEFT